MKSQKNIFLCLSLAAFAACSTPVVDQTKSLKEPFEAIHSIDGKYSIVNVNKVTYNLYVGNSSETIHWEEAIATNISDSVYTLNAMSKHREYFGLVSNGDTTILSNRHIKMEGPINFRDIGGLKTKDGKQVKWGLLFRSDKLSECTTSDTLKMEALGIKTIIDFRNNTETKEEPDVYPSAIHHIHIATGDDFDTKNWIQQLKDKDPYELKNMMSDLYLDIPLKYSQSYREYFSLLLHEENTPLLFHCTAGKDRTGMASAFLLYILGVDEETILNEYSLSNYYYAEKIAEYKSKFKFYGIDEGIADAIMYNKQEYLKNIFNGLAKEYGSFDNFLLEACGVDEEAKLKLKALYLI